MNQSTMRISRPDGVTLYVQRWLPPGTAKAFLLLVHGLQDRSEYYRPVAEELVGRGCAVGAYDLRGHVESRGSPS